MDRQSLERFLPDKFGMDELVIDNVNLHMERMDDGSMWVGIYRGDKRISLFLRAEKRSLTVNVAEDEIGISRVREGGRVG